MRRFDRCATLLIPPAIPLEASPRTGAAGGDGVAETLGQIWALADQVCACRDVDCLAKVGATLRPLLEALRDSRPGGAKKATLLQQGAATVARIQKCVAAFEAAPRQPEAPAK